MRREGYEFEVGPPKVITKRDEVTGERLEPMEEAVVEVPEEHVGQVRAGGGAGARGQGGGSWLVGARAREAGGKHTLTACCACCLRRTGGGPDGPAQGADDRHDRGWGGHDERGLCCVRRTARAGRGAILPSCQARPGRPALLLTRARAPTPSHPLSTQAPRAPRASSTRSPRAPCWACATPCSPPPRAPPCSTPTSSGGCQGAGAEEGGSPVGRPLEARKGLPCGHAAATSTHVRSADRPLTPPVLRPPPAATRRTWAKSRHASRAAWWALRRAR